MGAIFHSFLQILPERKSCLGMDFKACRQVMTIRAWIARGWEITANNFSCNGKFSAKIFTLFCRFRRRLISLEKREFVTFQTCR